MSPTEAAERAAVEVVLLVRELPDTADGNSAAAIQLADAFTGWPVEQLIELGNVANLQRGVNATALTST